MLSRRGTRFSRVDGVIGLVIIQSTFGTCVSHERPEIALRALGRGKPSGATEAERRRLWNGSRATLVCSCRTFGWVGHIPTDSASQYPVALAARCSQVVVFRWSGVMLFALACHHLMFFTLCFLGSRRGEDAREHYLRLPGIAAFGNGGVSAPSGGGGPRRHFRRRRFRQVGTGRREYNLHRIVTRRLADRAVPFGDAGLVGLSHHLS